MYVLMVALVVAGALLPLHHPEQTVVAPPGRLSANSTSRVSMLSMVLVATSKAIRCVPPTAHHGSTETLSQGTYQRLFVALATQVPHSDDPQLPLWPPVQPSHSIRTPMVDGGALPAMTVP